jgi:Ni,Fe-hydrogenase III large subunit
MFNITTGSGLFSEKKRRKKNCFISVRMAKKVTRVGPASRKGGLPTDKFQLTSGYKTHLVLPK